jgi:DNA-binding MarR family transcriptional regulator
VPDEPTPAAAPRPEWFTDPGAAFLLSQVGFHTSRRWTERLEPLGVDARHVVLLRLVAAREGRSQQEMGAAMGLPPSRIVALVDDLEHDRLVERRRDRRDRRRHGLYLTSEGRRLLAAVARVSAAHEREICAALGDAEREQLVDLLTRIATDQGLIRGVHPGVDSDAD